MSQGMRQDGEVGTTRHSSTVWEGLSRNLGLSDSLESKENIESGKDLVGEFRVRSSTQFAISPRVQDDRLFVVHACVAQK